MPAGRARDDRCLQQREEEPDVAQPEEHGAPRLLLAGAGRELAAIADEIEALSLQQPALEGRTAKQKNPHPKGSLAYTSWVCARLGGWTGYYGKPGPITMMHGLRSLKAMLNGWKLRTDV